MSSVLCDKPYTSSDKWVASIIAGIFFIILASPVTFKFVNTNVSQPLGLSTADYNGCPNLTGLIVHAVVFTLVMRLSMSLNSKEKCAHPYSSTDKWVVSIIGGLLFLLIASPFLYEIVNSLTSALGLVIADANGCPNVSGLILHTAVFIIIVRLLMR